MAIGRLSFIFAILILSGQAPVASACPCHTNPLSAGQLKKLRHRISQDEKMRRGPSSENGPMPVLPVNWGHQNPAGLRPEAILANATSEALNYAWSLPGTTDAVAASPVALLRSEFHPYGDGQTNAVASFGTSWRSNTPPLVAVRIARSDGTALIRFTLDGSLPLKNPVLNVFQKSKLEKVPVRRDSANQWVAEWKSATLEPFWLQPDGWSDGFPLWFRHPVYSIPALRQALPPSAGHLAAGAGIPDPERIAKESAENHQSAFGALLNHAFSSAFNSTPYNPQNIHAEFPSPGGIVTGVGQGWTWVAEKPKAPFKTLYTCFERRRPDRESLAKDGGVASGGGWHEIGDPAETILNSLESQPVVVGWGTRKPVRSPDAAGFAYGLSDVATVRWLRPGEAMMTSLGDFHWFYFHANQEVCTEEWVHPCVPDETNHLGFQCG